MQYVPTDLPQYWKLHNRSDFSNAVIQSDAVLLFSQDGQTLMAKTHQGTFVPMGGGTASLRAGVLVSDSGTLKVQPLKFDGTVPSDSGALQGLSNSSLLIFETGHQEPAYDGQGSTAGDNPFQLTDYIQSTGTQWIDTGYYPTSTSKFQLVANVASDNTAYVCPFGARQFDSGEATAKGALIFLKYSSENILTANWGVADYQLYPTQKFFNIKCEYSLSSGYVVLKTENLSNCIAYSFTGGTVTNSYTMYLFVLNSGNSANSVTICKMKLYRFRIYEGDTLVHEFIPWTDSQDVVCLKDTITGNLKYNGGSGSFTRGTDNN